jgi:thioredoxin reductase
MASLADILVIGGGIAGLSAAATIVRQDHNTVVLDSQKYRNAGSQYMHTLATWDHRSPEDWRAAARKDFERYGTVTVENEDVVKVEKLRDGIFKASAASGKTWTARKLILATGVEDVFPDIPGYAESWISGMLVATHSLASQFLANYTCFKLSLPLLPRLGREGHSVLRYSCRRRMCSSSTSTTFRTSSLAHLQRSHNLYSWELTIGGRH